MESLGFVLFFTVVMLAWLGQVSQLRMCVRRVSQLPVWAGHAQRITNTSGRTRGVVQSPGHAKGLSALRARAHQYYDSGRGRPRLHLN